MGDFKEMNEIQIYLNVQYIRLIQRRIQNPAEHLQWRFYAKIVDG